MEWWHIAMFLWSNAVVVLVLNVRLYADAVVLLILSYVIKVRWCLFPVWGSFDSFQMSSVVKDNYFKCCNRNNSA